MYSLKPTDEEVKALVRLSKDNSFDVFRNMLEGSLKTLRDESDGDIEYGRELTNKGNRQVIREILNLTDREEINKISEKVKKRNGTKAKYQI